TGSTVGPAVPAVAAAPLSKPASRATTGPARHTSARPANRHREGVPVLKDFKTFLLRGNVVDLAIAVVIGAAFGAVVQALVKDLITPLVSIPGKANFQSLKFTVRHSVFAYGDFLNALIAFLSIAAAVFFF